MQAFAAQLTGNLLALWRQQDHGNIDESWHAFGIPARLLVQRHQTTINVLSESFFDSYRFLSGAKGRTPAWVPKVVPASQIDTVLDVTGRIGMKVAQPGRTLAAASDVAFVKVSGAAQRLGRVAEQGGLLQTAAHDSEHPRWQRVVHSSHPCDFCRMLAGRGAVYHSQATSDFRSHDHCNCATVAVYPGAEPLPPGVLAMLPADAQGDLSVMDALPEWRKWMRQDYQDGLYAKGDNPTKEAKRLGLVSVKEYVNWVRRGGQESYEDWRKLDKAGRLTRYGVKALPTA